MISTNQSNSNLKYEGIHYQSSQHFDTYREFMFFALRLYNQLTMHPFMWQNFHYKSKNFVQHTHTQKENIYIYEYIKMQKSQDICQFQHRRQIASATQPRGTSIAIFSKLRPIAVHIHGFYN
jgi:hypothetical protein